MSFEMQEDFFKPMNNYVYSKTINDRFNNAKKI